jgi:hypothetical protein
MKTKGCSGCGETRTTSAIDNYGQRYVAYACACRVREQNTNPTISAPRALIDEGRALLAGAKAQNDGKRRPGDVFLGTLLDLFERSLDELDALHDVSAAAHEVCMLQPATIARSDAEASRFQRLYDALQKVASK